MQPAEGCSTTASLAADDCIAGDATARASLSFKLELPSSRVSQTSVVWSTDTLWTALDGSLVNVASRTRGAGGFCSLRAAATLDLRSTATGLGEVGCWRRLDFEQDCGVRLIIRGLTLGDLRPACEHVLDVTGVPGTDLLDTSDLVLSGVVRPPVDTQPVTDLRAP